MDAQTMARAALAQLGICTVCGERVTDPDRVNFYLRISARSTLVCETCVWGPDGAPVDARRLR